MQKGMNASCNKDTKMTSKESFSPAQTNTELSSIVRAKNIMKVVMNSTFLIENLLSQDKIPSPIYLLQVIFLVEILHVKGQT